MTRFKSFIQSVPRRTTPLLLVVTMLIGCVTSPAPKEPLIRPAPVKQPPLKPGEAASQASADTMHDLCGSFLFYFAVHRVLPPSLEDLRADQGLDAGAIVSPSTGNGFLYDKGGVPIPRIGQRIYVIEAESRKGLRWAIAIDPPAPGVPLVTRVVAVTDADLQPVAPSQAPR